MSLNSDQTSSTEQSNASQKEKELPLNLEHFLGAVQDASRRSRQILSIMIFASVLVLMALVNSLIPELNWFSSETEVPRMVRRHIIFPKGESASTGQFPTPVNNLATYIFENERILNNPLSYQDSLTVMYLNLQGTLRQHFKLNHPSLVPTMSSTFRERIDRYKLLVEAINYAQNNGYSDKSLLNEYLNDSNRLNTEHFTLVRVPILGISFHVNYLGVYSGLTWIALYYFLYFSLTREHISLKVAFRRGWTDNKHHHYYFYEFLSMQQVLSIPRKLFVAPKWTQVFFTNFGYVAASFPWIIFTFLCAYDKYSFHYAHETNRGLAIGTLSTEIFFWGVITWLWIIVLLRWKKMDELWNNLSFEYNFEAIRECVGDDKDIDFKEFIEVNITETDKPAIQMLWFLFASKMMDKNISVQGGINLFERFLNSVYQTKFLDKNYLKSKIERAPIKPTEELVEKYWAALNAWFLTKGKKNVGSSFRRTFRDMLLELRS